MYSKDDLLTGIIGAEFNYSREFCKVQTTEYGLRFTDYNLLDMHCHNFLEQTKVK